MNRFELEKQALDQFQKGVDAHLSMLRFEMAVMALAETVLATPIQSIPQVFDNPTVQKFFYSAQRLASRVLGAERLLVRLTEFVRLSEAHFAGKNELMAVRARQMLHEIEQQGATGNG